MPWFHQRPNLLTMYGSLTPLPFQRRFTPLASAGMQYYTIPTWTASGDFEIELEFSLVGTPSNETLLVFGKYLIRVQSDTGIRIFGDVDVGSIPFTVPSLGGQLHSLKVSGNSTIANVSLELDGVSYGEKIGSLPNFTGDSYIGRFATAYTDSYIANVSLQTAGDNRLYKLDENFGETSIVKNDLATLGSELWTFGNVVPDGTSASNEILTGVSSGGVPTNSTLLVTLSWVNLTGRLRLLVGSDTSANTGVQVGNTGSVTLLMNPLLNTRLQLQDQNGGAIADSATVTVKEAPGYGEAINIAESQLFTEVADGWEGVELWTFGNPIILPFAVVNDTLAGVSSGGVESNTVHRFVNTVESAPINCNFRLRIGSFNASAITGNGVFEGTGNSLSGSRLLLQERGSDGDSQGAVVTTSVKQFLEVA